MNYLEKALDLDIHLISDYHECKAITEYLFQEISEKLIIRNVARSKETLKLAIINLFISYITGTPIKYSRNRNNYLSHKRYGKLHVKYKRLIPIVDVLEKLGYVHQRIGFFDRDRSFGRETRMLPTAKLIALFKDHLHDNLQFIEKAQPSEAIQLKDNNKDHIDYVDTRSIGDMRANLRRYNDFIAQQRIDVVAPASVMVNARFLIGLKIGLLKGVVNFNDLSLIGEKMNRYELSPLGEEIYQSLFPMTGPVLSGSQELGKDLIVISDTSNTDHTSYPIAVSVDNRTVYDYVVDTCSTPTYYHNLHYIVYLSTMTKTLREIKDEKTRNAELLRKRQIADFGLQGLNFQSLYQYLHRVFNNETFKQGGRFYGAFHLKLPKELRAHVKINGAPTVELDYSALHIRMLYHLENIDYVEDPYKAICDYETERKVYKLVQLIAINSKNEKKAVMAIRDQLRKKNIDFDLSNKSILHCINKFKSHHTTIAKYLNSGVGLRLQNIDSRITDRILQTMTKNQIPCLPVHDSYIVRREDEIFLQEVMNQSYEQFMGFRPIIK